MNIFSKDTVFINNKYSDFEKLNHHARSAMGSDHWKDGRYSVFSRQRFESHTWTHRCNRTERSQSGALVLQSGDVCVLCPLLHHWQEMICSFNLLLSVISIPFSFMGIQAKTPWWRLAAPRSRIPMLTGYNLLLSFLPLPASENTNCFQFTSIPHTNQIILDCTNLYDANCNLSDPGTWD